MSLHINYDVSAREVLTNPDFPRRMQLMKQAGVEQLWIFGYFYGHHEVDPEMIYQAKLRLEEEGLRTGIVSLPVGHPGNSLNPDDPTLEMAIHPEWRYRTGRDGEKEYFSACIDETMIAHNRAAAIEYAQMGFTKHFFDDDLRLGNWGSAVCGCYCERCVSRFNQRIGGRFDRPQLVAAIEGDEAIREAWMQYNCDKVTDFMCETAIPGMTSGIMVMHNGDRRHGVSIPDIKKAVPDCMFRVGEAHFSDLEYHFPGGRESLAESIRSHLALIGGNPAYSETTVFPAEALSPESWIDKMKLEISLGLRNLFLMSGTWFLTDRYWHALRDNRAALEEMAAGLEA